MMFCKKCGKEIENDSIFCKYCGEKIISEKLKIQISNHTIDHIFDLFVEEDTTISDLVDMLLLKRIVPNERTPVQTLQVYTKDEILYMAGMTEKLEDSVKKYLKNDNVINIRYTETPKTIHNHYDDPRNMVCLYGCPTSSKVSTEATNFKKY